MHKLWARHTRPPPSPRAAACAPAPAAAGDDEGGGGETPREDGPDGECDSVRPWGGQRPRSQSPPAPWDWRKGPKGRTWREAGLERGEDGPDEAMNAGQAVDWALYAHGAGCGGLAAAGAEELERLWSPLRLGGSPRAAWLD